MYAPEASVEAMMLDSNATEIDREERPEVCALLDFLPTGESEHNCPEDVRLWIWLKAAFRSHGEHTWVEKRKSER